MFKVEKKIFLLGIFYFVFTTILLLLSPIIGQATGFLPNNGLNENILFFSFFIFFNVFIALMIFGSEYKTNTKNVIKIIIIIIISIGFGLVQWFLYSLSNVRADIDPELEIFLNIILPIILNLFLTSFFTSFVVWIILAQNHDNIGKEFITKNWLSFLNHHRDYHFITEKEVLIYSKGCFWLIEFDKYSNLVLDFGGEGIVINNLKEEVNDLVLETETEISKPNQYAQKLNLQKTTIEEKLQISLTIVIVNTGVRKTQFKGIIPDGIILERYNELDRLLKQKKEITTPINFKEMKQKI
ncbi:MAG: hypothetical protein GQ557_02675 [Mycoplasmataceae bacterium]|nr:hypothetical protein [Mycoplasmataceae bacterium]